MKRGSSSTKQSKAKRARRQSLTPAQIADVRAVAKRVSRENTELKYTDYTDSVSVTTAGYLFALTSNLTKGDQGLNSCDGNQLIPAHLTFRHYWTSGIIHNVCRTIVFQWNDFSTPTMDNVLQDITVANGLLPMQYSEIGNKLNLNVLYDEMFVLAPDTPGTSEAVYWKQVFIPGKRLDHIRFNPSSNQQTSGAIWCLVVSDDAIAPSPAAYVSSRLAFTD